MEESDDDNDDMVSWNELASCFLCMMETMQVVMQPMMITFALLPLCIAAEAAPW